MPQLQKAREYQVSGVIQITVVARSAEAAVKMAQKRADSIETTRTIIGLDNISTGQRASVGLDEAAKLDQ